MATSTAKNIDTMSNSNGNDNVSIQKPKRKVGRPGRKKIDTEAKNRRTAQNRAAQRAFRERKEQKLKSLESKISNLEKINEQSEYESALLKNHLADLIHEITRFRPKSQKDLQVLDLLARNNIIKEELKLQNLQEDENIANLDNPKGIQTTTTTPTTTANLTTASSSSSPNEVQPDVTPQLLKRESHIGIKPEPIYTPDASNSPMSINSNGNNNNAGHGITEQSLFAAAAAADIAAAMGNNNYTNTTGISNNNISGTCSGGCNNSNTNDSDLNSDKKYNSISGSSNGSSNMDIIDDLFNAAYSLDNSDQFGNNNANDLSLSVSTTTNSEINSEYNMTNHFPDISNNTNMFSIYGAIGSNNNNNGIATTNINNNSSNTFGQTVPQFTLNNLTNTWNNNFTASASDHITSSESSVVDGNDLAAIQYAFDVPSQLKTTGNDNNNNNSNHDNSNNVTNVNGNGPHFMSFLNSSLAFPDMDDNVMFREPVPENTSCSEPTPDCACNHDNTVDDDHHQSSKPIKCELLTRHIINDESIQSILRDKNFQATGNSTVASACAADCDGKQCNRVTLPYDKAGKTMKCADLWRHITTLPKYSAVDIDNLCDELMTKINYSDEGITIKPRDFDTALKKQIMS
ncbi:similar to Saccharomyces cerevisiae YDR423C CAD1 AP-1-like basic leucine zipper (bZIP) transcriptional activator involved in stress responses [Maudiozyma saulgeensis]|uniref:Similar to Saccharomyces cerevisiae YDR423C CAD1 AP-1-like basic leucine zipper (BZIP) transcriptional activator involved in stress responses n=1 Tax=Maudiozyma saulgeensis TaxID=1789683 RepID=A0A1X7R2F0_9SACH|nr:similar to Saccharomyces cerevisiae YDR423C CAD1 AP-1-like basic leucine zipper (bZIP) transcriptional activator involved in stress responses [Kazachstania saulgeensis]